MGVVSRSTAPIPRLFCSYTLVTQLGKKQEAEEVSWDKVKKEQNELDKPKKRSREELLNNTGEFDSTKGFARAGERVSRLFK